MESGIKGAFFEVEEAVRTLLDFLGDPVAVARLLSQNFKNEGRKCALQVHTSEFYASELRMSSGESLTSGFDLVAEGLDLGLRSEADEFARLGIPVGEEPSRAGAGGLLGVNGD